jgi:malonyl CoA-acyl carrier protein transacylase
MADTKMYAQFGGQGSGWLEELRSLAHAPGTTLTHTIITRTLEALEEELAIANVDLKYLLPLGLNVRDWIYDTKSKSPPKEYLSYAPVSYPCIGLTQLSQYAHTWSHLKAQSGDMVNMLNGKCLSYFILPVCTDGLILAFVQARLAIVKE